VCICSNCGLVFSVHDDIPYSREPNISCDADWGNVRFCKGQRFDVLEPDLPDDVKRVLDVGSSRGHFVRWMQEVNPMAEIVALEPDTRIASYPEGVKFIGKRLEDADLPKDYFDFVYCCQTLEHTDSATTILEKIRECLSPNGILFLEVPNLMVIGYPYNTEEFFIDKHNFHFTDETIEAYLNKCGFKIYSQRDDNLNVSVFAMKSDSPVIWSSVYDWKIKELISTYSAGIKLNRGRITEVVRKINSTLNTTMKVAFWGANTMFDLMVKYGGLDPTRIGLLADDYICDCIDSIHGVPVKSSEEFRIYQPDVVFILARFSADILAKKARAFGIRNVIKFEDLL
jgi:SAM-dependent methyltransferase